MRCSDAFILQPRVVSSIRHLNSWLPLTNVRHNHPTSTARTNTCTQQHPDVQQLNTNINKHTSLGSSVLYIHIPRCRHSFCSKEQISNNNKGLRIPLSRIGSRHSTYGSAGNNNRKSTLHIWKCILVPTATTSSAFITVTTRRQSRTFSHTITHISACTYTPISAYQFRIHYAHIPHTFL